LPLLVAAARSKDLKALLQTHLKQTAGHVQALNDVATYLDCKLPIKSCVPVTKLIGEGVKVIGKRLVSSEQDAALIGVGRKIEQFEINAYQDLCATATDAGLTHVVALLTSILNQEEMANELLGELQAGNGPLDRIFQNVSLRRAGARR
jgi:ferritin-like metal-binding protein YciE